MTDVNPKAQVARRDSKPRLDLLEHEADVVIAAAMEDGAKKYGAGNYQTIPISMRVYLAAIKRHVGALLDWEDLAQDSGVHHLGHVGANVHILLKAIADWNIDDDRGPEGQTQEQREAEMLSNLLQGRGHDYVYDPGSD